MCCGHIQSTHGAVPISLLQCIGSNAIAGFGPSSRPWSLYDVCYILEWWPPFCFFTFELPETSRFEHYIIESGLRRLFNRVLDFDIFSLTFPATLIVVLNDYADSYDERLKSIQCLANATDIVSNHGTRSTEYYTCLRWSSLLPKFLEPKLLVTCPR